jgi:hypothetical protein
MQGVSQWRSFFEARLQQLNTVKDMSDSGSSGGSISTQDYDPKVRDFIYRPRSLTGGSLDSQPASTTSGSHGGSLGTNCLLSKSLVATGSESAPGDVRGSIRATTSNSD